MILKGDLIDYSYFDIIARKLYLLSFSFRSYGINWWNINIIERIDIELVEVG